MYHVRQDQNENSWQLRQMRGLQNECDRDKM